MKVVHDTNVFISGVFFGGPPYQILKAWRTPRKFVDKFIGKGVSR
jgi:predicted nucleic acid-binding protein